MRAWLHGCVWLRVWVRVWLCSCVVPISVPALQPPCPSTSSRLRILKEVSGVEPGWVEIIPLNRVTVQVLT